MNAIRMILVPWGLGSTFPGTTGVPHAAEVLSVSPQGLVCVLRADLPTPFGCVDVSAVGGEMGAAIDEMTATFNRVAGADQVGHVEQVADVVEQVADTVEQVAGAVDNVVGIFHRRGRRGRRRPGRGPRR